MVNIQHFLSTKIIKYIQVRHLNQCNLDNYQFFQLTAFLGEIIEFYFQKGNFLENLMPTFNEETKNKALILKMQLPTEQRVHCVKSVQIRSFFWPYFPAEYGEKPVAICK